MTKLASVCALFFAVCGVSAFNVINSTTSIVNSSFNVINNTTSIVNSFFAISYYYMGPQTFHVTAPVVISPSDGCTSPVESIEGKIWVVDSMGCIPETKMRLARQGRALGIIEFPAVLARDGNLGYASYAFWDFDRSGLDIPYVLSSYDFPVFVKSLTATSPAAASPGADLMIELFPSDNEAWLQFYRHSPYVTVGMVLTIWCLILAIVAAIRLGQFISHLGLKDLLSHWAMLFQILQNVEKAVYLRTSFQGIYILPVETVLVTLSYPFIIASTTLSLVFWRYVGEIGGPSQRHRGFIVLFILSFFAVNIAFGIAFAITQTENLVVAFMAVEITLWIGLDFALLYLGWKRLWGLQKFGSVDSQKMIRSTTIWLTSSAVFDLCSQPFLMLALVPTVFYSRLGWSMFLLGSFTCQCLGSTCQLMLFHLPARRTSQVQVPARKCTL